MDTTPTLGLRTNIGTDPFLRDDFVFNWGRLDDAPGVTHGSAADRSALTWGTDQAGRLFLQEETRQLFQWTGSAWVDVLQPGESFGATIASPALGTPAAGASGTYSFPAVTLLRPGRIVGTMSLVWQCPQNQMFYSEFLPYVDGASMAPMAAVGRLALVGAATTTQQDTLSVPFRSGVLTAGSHTPQIRVSSHTGNHATMLNAAYAAVVAN